MMDLKFVWHYHKSTKVLVEPLNVPIQHRVSYFIGVYQGKTNPKYLAERIKLIRAVKGELPESVMIVARTLIQSLRGAGGMSAKRMAWKNWLVAIDHPELLKLHKKECPNCNFDEVHKKLTAKKDA